MMNLSRAVLLSGIALCAGCSPRHDAPPQHAAPPPQHASPPAAKPSQPPPPSQSAPPAPTPPPTGAPADKPPTTMPALPLIDSSPYTGPAVTLKVLELETYPPQPVASVEVNTPTGGWKLTRDQEVIVDGTAKLFYTLEKPAAHEMVIQSFVILRDSFKSVNPGFTHAEVYIHQSQRGVSTFTTNYRLAARE